MSMKVALNILFSDIKLLFSHNRSPNFERNSTSSVPSKFSPASNEYLTKLRDRFRLTDVIAGKANDVARLLSVTGWASGLWDHDGWNQPTKSDPISIIEEAQSGKSFRCVEYAIVLAGALSALGYPSRVLGLMTQDVETRKYGAGHVVVEVFLHDQNSWAMVDGQFGALATVDGLPASAADFAEALHTAPESAGGLSSALDFNLKKYKKWIKPYLYYFNTGIDNRYGLEKSSDNMICLGPSQAKEPKCFQGIGPLNYKIYTHSISDFYPDADRIHYQ